MIQSANFEKLPDHAALDPIFNSSEIKPHDYALSDNMLAVMERFIAESDDIDRSGPTGMATVLVPGDSPFSGFGRTMESRIFGPQGHDFVSEMNPYEHGSSFLYTVRPKKEGKPSGVAHTKRIVLPFTSITPEGVRITGQEVIDDRLRAEPLTDQYAASPEDAIASLGMRPYWDRFMCISSNINTRRVPLESAVPPSIVSYLGVFGLAEGFQIDHVLAYMNNSALKSLGSMGLKADSYEQYHPPKDESRKSYDDNYIAVRVSRTEHNLSVIENALKFIGKTPMHRLVVSGAAE